MAFLVVLLLMVVGVAGYVLAIGMRFRDIPLLVLVTSLVFFLARFDFMLHLNFGGRPYVGINIYLVLILVLLLALRANVSRPLSKVIFLPIPFLVLFSLFSLFSGFLNGGLAGFFSAIQVLVIAMTPALLGWCLVELYPRRDGDSLGIRRVVIVSLGVVTPLILIVSALMPGVFGGVLGWDSIASESDLGFVRGWSPLGSTIATGALIVMAYGFALNEAVVNRSFTHGLIAVLASVSLLFTASRSVLLAFLIFNLVYMVLIGFRARVFKVAVLPLGVLGAIVWYSFKAGTINFERFLETNDFSFYIRLSSLNAALVQFLKNIPWGQGPGLLYSQIRTDWLDPQAGGDQVRLMLVGDQWSAMEPHNLYLMLLAEHGLFAALSFFLAAVMVLVAVMRAPVCNSRTARSEKAVYVGIWTSTMLILVTASWPLINQKFTVFFWLVLFSGLHWAYCRHRSQAALS